MSSGLSQLSESTLASPTIKKKGIKKRLVKLFSRSEGNLKEKYHTASDGDNCFTEDVSMSTVEEGHLVKKGRSSWSEKRGKKERSDAENERQGWGHSLPRLRYHRAEDSMSRSSKRASKTRSLSSSEMNLPAPGFLQRFGSLTWRKKKPSVLDGSGLASPESTLVDTHWSLGQLNRPVDSVSDLKDERPKSCYVEALFTESALESSDFCPKDNQNIQKNLEISATFDCLADSTVSYCSSEEDAGDKITQLQSFMSSNEKEENEQVVLPFWAQSILKEYMPEYHKPQPSPVLKKQEEGEEDKCLHGELTYNTSQVTMTEEQINSAPHSPSQSEKSLEPYQYSQTHPKCPSSENEEQDTPQLNPPYPAVQEEALAQNVTESQATPGPHKVRYEIIITMKKEGQMDETDVPELGGAMSIGEELVGPDLNLSPSLECQACGHHRAGTTALTAHAHTEQPKNYTNLEDEKISELRGGETCVRAHLDRDISLAGDEQQDLLVCEQTPEHYRSQSPNMEKKCSLDNEHSHSPGRAQPSRMVLSNNEVSRVPTNRDRNSYVGHVMDMRKVFESNGSKEDFIHNLKSVKPNSYSSVREKYTVTQNELGDLHKPIYSQVFKPPKPSLDRKGCNELFPHLARKDSVNAAQAWESSKEMNSRSVLEKDMIHLRDRDVKVKETKHKHTILPLKDLHVHPRTPTPPPDKSRTMSVFLTSPKGWRKESLRSLSPRLLHEQTDGNMDCAKPVLNKSPDKFTFTYNKDGYQNYGTDSFSAKPVEKASIKVYKGTAKEINNNVLITNPLITSKEQSENSYKMTILQDESDLNNIGESSTDRNLTLESNTLTAIYKLSERQLRDTGTREEVMLQLAEQERPMQDPAIISWEQTESPDDQSVFTKSNTIIRGESDDYYEQSNFFGTVESHITENYKVMDNPVTSDNMINMNYLTSEQPIFLDYTIPFVTTNVYKGATQDASQHCHIAESNTESVTRRNYINPPGEIITGTAVSGNTFGKTQTRSFIWDFPEYSGQWPTSMVLENIHTDYMNDNSYNGWHKAKAQMVYTSTEDESEQKEQDKPISEVLTKAGNIIISHPEVKGYRTVNKTEQSSESGENRNQANDGIAADKIGLDLGSTNQQKADNESTKQEHTKQSYDSGIHEGDLQVVVQHSVGLSEDKARISNASQNVDKTFSVVTNDKPVCTILPVGNDIENVPCLTQNALVPSKETSQKQSTIQQKELTHIHQDGIIDINPVNKEIYNHMKDEEKTHQAREMLFHILSKEISVEHVYDFREKDLEKCMANDNIDIIDLAPSMEDQADNMSDLLDVHQAGDMLVYLDTKEALVEQDNDQADFLQKPEELVGQTYDAIDIVTCVTQDSLVFAPSIEECLQQATSQPSKKFIHMHTIVEKDIMSEKEDQADSNINMNDEDKTHRVSELLFHIPSKEISVEHAYYQGERNLEKIEVANDNIDIVYITPSVENETENMSGSLAVGEAGDVLGYTYTKEASVEQDNHQAITDRLQKFEQLVDQTDNATDILTLEKETDENISKGEGDDKTDQMFDYICSAGVSEEHAFIQSKDYLIRKPKDVIDPPVIVIDESLEENQVENMRGSLAVDVAGDVLVYISTKEASVEQYNHKAITDRLQKLEQLVDQTDNATDILTLTKETDENIRWEVDDNKDQMFDYICSVNVSEEHGFIQSKEYLIQKPMDVIDPNVNVIDECLEENPEENDSGLEDEDTVDIQSYRLMTGKSVENTNEKPSSEKPVVQENHYASLTDSSSKDIQAEHIINLTAEDIKGHSNNSQNVIFFASFNEASVEHNKYKPVAINQGENVLNQSNGIISILPTDELHKQVEFITMDPKVERHSENSLLANKNDIQAIVDKYRSDYVTDDRNLLIQEAQKVENRNPTSSTGFHSHSGQISSEISSKVCQESVQDADTQASGHSIIEDKGCPDVLEPSMQKVLTNLSEQSVQLVQGSHVSNTVNVRNDITTEYTGDRYNLQIEEESSKDMEMWINTLRHLESHSGQISTEINSKVCQESMPDADTQTTGQSNIEDKGSPDVLEPSVQKVLTNLSEQSVQLEQGSQTYNTVHVSNDITTEYTGDRYNLQIQEESSKDMEMWINTLRYLESHSGKISSEINSKVCQESVPDADTQTTGQSNTEDKGSPDVLEPSVQKLLTNLSEQSVQLEQGSQTYNTVHVSNDITTEYTGDRYNLQIEEESSKDMEMWINTLRHLESHSGQISSEISSKVCQESVQDADTQTTDQSNIEDKGSPDVLEPSVQKVLTNLSEQSVQLEQGSQIYNTVHVSNDITSEYTGDRYNLQIEEESSKDMEMWINTLRHLESHSGQISSEITSKVCQESVQDADTQTTGQSNTEDKGSTDVLEPSVQKLLTNLSEQSVQFVQGSQAYNMVHVRNDITKEYTGDQYNLQSEEESSKDMAMWINTLRHLEIPEFMKYQRVPRQPRHSALSMYATLPPIKEDVCSPNSDHIDSDSLPQEKNDDLEISQDTKPILNLEHNEKKYSWEKDFEKPIQISPLEMMRKHSGEEVERTTSHKSSLTQNLSQRQESIIGSLLLSERQERKNEQNEGKSFSRLKSSLLLSSYIKPKKEPLSVNGEEEEILSDSVHTEAGSTQPNVVVPRIPESPKHPVTGTDTPPKHTVDSVPPLVSKELPCKSNLRIVSQFKASTDIWHHTKKEHGKVNPRPGKVLLFSDLGFNGKCYEINGNVSDTSEWELQETISIRVIRGGWILYEEPRFHGRRVMLLEGDAELKCPWLEHTDSNREPQTTSAFWVGSLRHVVRDFRVPKISLFLQPNGEGEKVQIEGAAPDMSEYGGTIKTESIIVHCGMWLVFSKPLYQGDPYILEPGGYPNRRSWGAEDPQVCSLEAARIGGPIVEKPNEPKLLLFQMPEFEGTCLEVTRDMNSIQGEHNLQGEKLYSVGSLKVVGGCWVGYEKEGFRGHQYLLEEGDFNDFSDWGGCTEELGSVRLIRTDFSQPEIVLYELPGCLEGPCLRLSESLADLEEAQYGTRTGSIHVLSGVWVAYENVDFSGEQYILEKGVYHNYQDWGAENGKISSVQPVIQVGGNSLHFLAKIHMFSEPNFYGDCLTCIGGHMELPELFSLQSCRVECGSWSLYEGENQSGEQYILSEGEYPTRTAMGCLTPCPLRSLKMVPLYFSIPSLSLHGLERFEGKELDFTEEVRSLQGEGYNNHVMSVSVKSGIWVVYEHSDFRGRQWLLERKQIPNWLLYSGLQRIGSLCPIRQRTVYFRLRNRNLGLFLCVAELTEDMKAARVLVTEPQDGRCLLWYYEEGRLKNQMAPHMNLQVIGQSSSGTKVVLWSESRKPIQTWNLEDSGCITSCLFKGMCLDVKGGQCYDSDHVIIWETTEDRLTQQWDLEVF
ncbi:uncharacterized protein crybg2.L [Xenopus laevis]|uniref:Uncharacterized protein crybg2.L n=2 Tax=Xenopus laevis TaxID=8355 RepID=A0A1L8HEC5_XENLA|nr:uncharacterized protein crybg2.L [Xenopus laevis]OCT94442.1 hypothetical protein XELAEV_18012113mg [Xenopus laevis]